MNNDLIEEKIKDLEIEMWDAFSQGDSISFCKLVSDEAMMICGGYRESGCEYGKIVAQVRLDGYELSDFTVKVISPYSILTNYVVTVKCPDPSISGTFRVSSLWMQNKDQWELVFNQDSRLP